MVYKGQHTIFGPPGVDMAPAPAIAGGKGL